MEAVKKKDETLVENLPIEIRNQLSEALTDFEQKREVAEKAEDALRKIISTYNKGRFELLLKKWKEEGLGWCTKCKKIVNVDELKLILTWGNEYSEGGYENSCYGYDRFKRLYNACATCRQEMLAKNGRYGKWDSSAEDQASFFAREEVDEDDPELTDDIGLDDLSKQKHPNVIDSDLETEWNIPPAIVIGSDFGGCQKYLYVSGVHIPSFAGFREVS